jgi:hypothetical protein
MGDVFVGQIELADPTHNAYRVAPTKDLRRNISWARPIDNGSSRPYDLDETVLCADTAVGRLILGRAPSPEMAPENFVVTRDDERQAEIFTQDVLAVTRQAPEDKPLNYRLKKEEALLPGAVHLRHPNSPANMGLYEDGSIVLSTGMLANLLLSSDGGKVSFIAGGLVANIIPGLKFEIALNEVSGATTAETSSTTFVGGVSETSREREQVTMKATFQGDPDTDTPDASLEAGRCADLSDWGNAISARSLGTRLKRGFKVRIGDFMDVELDLETKELRLTMVDEDAPSPFQFRINPEEAVLTRGQQFISFNDKGIFLKGDMIGLAGPWTMWSPQDLASFKHSSMPEVRSDGTQFLSPVCEWKTDPTGPGVKFVKSAFFGKNEEPAVLQSFLTDTYSRDMQDLATGMASHTHNITTPAPGSPTTPPIPPPSGVVDWLKSGVTYSDPTGNAYMNNISKILI